MGTRAKPAGYRVYLLQAAVRFVQAVTQLRGVQQISLLGSITTDRPNPKDIDLLLTIADDADITALAGHARRLKGAAQQVNLGADVFLGDDRGNYLGRTCHWKDCRPGVRSSCDAQHCGRRPHLHDDLGALRLSPETVQAPPITVWPVVVRRCPVPDDVEQMLMQFGAPPNNASEPTARESSSQRSKE